MYKTAGKRVGMMGRLRFSPSRLSISERKQLKRELNKKKKQLNGTLRVNKKKNVLGQISKKLSRSPGRITESSYLKMVIKSVLTHQELVLPPVELKEKNLKVYNEILKFGPKAWAKKQPNFKIILKQTASEMYPEFRTKKKVKPSRKSK